MKKWLLIFSLFILTVVVSRLWLGVYIHDEFFETHLFVKHRPIWKWKFYSPIGMSDKTMDDLSLKEQEEQKLFDEFVRDHGMSR